VRGGSWRQTPWTFPKSSLIASPSHPSPSSPAYSTRYASWPDAGLLEALSRGGECESIACEYWKKYRPIPILASITKYPVPVSFEPYQTSIWPCHRFLSIHWSETVMAVDSKLLNGRLIHVSSVIFFSNNCC